MNWRQWKRKRQWKKRKRQWKRKLKAFGWWWDNVSKIQHRNKILKMVGYIDPGQHGLSWCAFLSHRQDAIVREAERCGLWPPK